MKILDAASDDIRLGGEMTLDKNLKPVLNKIQVTFSVPMLFRALIYR